MIDELLRKNAAHEKTDLPAAIRRLSKNKDFQTVFRDMNEFAGGALASSVNQDGQFASYQEGRKHYPRFILAQLLSDANKKQPKKQKTDD